MLICIVGRVGILRDLRTATAEVKDEILAKIYIVPEKYLPY